MKSLQIKTIAALLVLTSCKMPEGPVSLSGDVPEATGWHMETVVEGLEHPWSAAWLNEDSLLITERPGRLLMVNLKDSSRKQIQGVPEVYSDGQAGLMDIALHPAFEENRLVYFTYSAGHQEANQTALARGIFENGELVDTEILFKAEPVKSDNQHFGSRMAWMPDSTMLISIGDGGNRPQKIDGILSREYARDLSAHLGKVVRIRDDGTIPGDNPYVNEDSAQPEIWSLGHRNVQGLTVDGESGNVWANEHGSRGGDELNLIKKGENYGWPEVTYSREYWYTKISDKTTMPGIVDPKVVWTPAQAPSGITVYQGDRFPEWKGNIFSGGLKGEQVRRIILDGETVIGEEKLTIGSRVRDVREGPDGYLYVLTDQENGRLIRIIPAD